MLLKKYYALTVPGLERIAWKDMRTRLGDVELIKEESGRIIFEYTGEPRNLLHLRSVENVYIFIRDITDLTRSRNSLGDIFKCIKRDDFQAAAMLHKEAHRSKPKKKLTFRVVAGMLGRHNFRRVDIQKTVEVALTGKCGWRIDKQNPILEARIDLEKDHALLGLKLTDEAMRNRDYKVAHLPASLKPTVAYCMTLLSNPSPRDIFVDPMCGAGTIAIERAFAGAYDRILAGDVQEEVVSAAKSNISESHRGIELFMWDISDIPIQDKSVSKIVCNMPFGKQIGSHSENRWLYLDFFKEMTRMLKPGGMAVLLSSERELINDLIQRYPYMKLIRYVYIELLGFKTCIYVISIH
jgi:23S rRNA G2445 N2-methylase RlmL